MYSKLRRNTSECCPSVHKIFGKNGHILKEISLFSAPKWAQSKKYVVTTIDPLPENRQNTKRGYL
jgi:hypothetical protein